MGILSFIVPSRNVHAFFGSHSCCGGMACGADVTAMSHGSFLLR